jgi:uncharacterized membrane protein HdeD (DUF308 family)
MSEPGSAIKSASRRGTVFGIFTVILGVLAMMAPMISGLSVAVMIAMLLIVAGVFRLIWAFGEDSIGKGVLTFIIGGLTLLAGVLVLVRPMVGLMSLTILLAAFFLVDGIFEIIAAFQAKPADGWGWLLFGGIVSVLLGWMIWSDWPVSGAWAIGILVGVKLLFAGLEMIFLGAAGRGLAKDVKEAAGGA